MGLGKSIIGIGVGMAIDVARRGVDGADRLRRTAGGALDGASEMASVLSEEIGSRISDLVQGLRGNTPGIVRGMGSSEYSCEGLDDEAARLKIIQIFEVMVKQNPNIGLSIGNSTYTIAELIEHVRGNTYLGQKILFLHRENDARLKRSKAQ